MVDTLTHAPWLVQACAAALLALVVVFAGFFMPRAFGRWRTLAKLIKGLEAFKNRPAEKPTELFSARKDLSHLWAEFSETLFAEKHFDAATNQEVLDAYRWTRPAAQFFNPQVVVVTRR